MGVIQLDCSRPGIAFTADELELLTTVSLQVSVVLENAALHAERLREERLRQEVAMAREIQAGFLPTDFAPPGLNGFELYAEVHPARDVSGDLYDFFPTADGKLLFLLGDVSGKGMPAAMFMVRVHTLSRHLASESVEPVRTLTRLNEVLAANNQTGLFVTMTQGVYDPRTGEVVLASGAHPLPLLRRPDGTTEEVPVPTGLPLGCLPIDPNVSEYRLKLEPGETLVLYTDGFTEAAVRGPDGKKMMFGPERLREVVGGARTRMSLKACAEETRRAIERYTGSPEQQDDLTLLMLRRQ
jgi:sigma-B regulation protein RsbU (phosphoserine phosphatase)